MRIGNVFKNKVNWKQMTRLFPLKIVIKAYFTPNIFYTITTRWRANSVGQSVILHNKTHFPCCFLYFLPCYFDRAKGTKQNFQASNVLYFLLLCFLYSYPIYYTRISLMTQIVFWALLYQQLDLRSVAITAIRLRFITILENNYLSLNCSKVFSFDVVEISATGPQQ